MDFQESQNDSEDLDDLHLTNKGLLFMLLYDALSEHGSTVASDDRLEDVVTRVYNQLIHCGVIDEVECHPLITEFFYEHNVTNVVRVEEEDFKLFSRSRLFSEDTCGVEDGQLFGILTTGCGVFSQCSDIHDLA